MLSHTHGHIKEKTSRISTYAHQVGLDVNLTKTEVMILETSNLQPTKVCVQDLPMTEHFKYLGSIVRQDGEREKSDRVARRGKVSIAG